MKIKLYLHGISEEKLINAWTMTIQINVQEQNFGWPSTIWQSRTSSNKGFLRGAVRHARALAEWSGNFKHTNTFLIDAPQAHNPTCHGIYLSLGLPYKSLPLKVFFLKIFNWTFLLILIGSRKDLIKYQRRSWPLFDFIQINILWLFVKPFLFLRT